MRSIRLLKVHSAGPGRVELPLAVLETAVLPLNYGPKIRVFYHLSMLSQTPVFTFSYVAKEQSGVYS